MNIINLTTQDVLDGLQTTEMGGDYYRNFTEYDKDNLLAINFKDLKLYSWFDSLYRKDTKALDEVINLIEECYNDEYTWEHYRFGRLFSLVNRLEKVYNENIDNSDIKSPIITGIALYKNYPVGTLIPKEILNYKDYYDILENSNKYDEDKKVILSRAKYLLESLMNQDVYPVGIYAGNIMVNPNNHSDVRFDGLDGMGVTRVESKNYVKSLKKSGRDLENEVWHNFSKFE